MKRALSGAPRTADDLFARLSHFPGTSEDFFTEALAATLGENQQLAREFCAVLAGARTLNGVRLSTAKVEAFTQHSHRELGARLDMRLVLNGKLTIALEHKLLSPETKGQTTRYAEVPGIDYFSVIAARPLKLPADLSDIWTDRLLAPSPSRLHFLWADFYDLIAGKGKWTSRDASSPLERAMVGLFDRHLLQSSHPIVGELTHPDLAVKTRANERFRELLAPTERALEHSSRGWTIWDSWQQTGASELWVEDGQSKRLLVAWVDPRFNPGALRIRLKSESDNAREQMRRALISEPLPNIGTLDVRKVNLNGQKRGAFALDLYIPWSILLHRCSGADKRGQAARILKSAIVGVIDRAS